MTLTQSAGVDSGYAWMRLGLSMLMMIIGGSGMYTVVVVLPEVQREFAVARADASMPYTLTMLGFGVGGVLLGRLADRWGVWMPLFVWAGCASGWASSSADCPARYGSSVSSRGYSSACWAAAQASVRSWPTLPCGS